MNFKLITKASFKDMPNYEDMIENGDFAQKGVFKAKSAIKFNMSGNCQYLYFTPDEDWTLSTFTVSVWVKQMDSSNFQSIISSGTNLASKLCSTYNGNTTPFMQSTSSTFLRPANKAFNLNEWTHLSFVRDDNKNHYLFINGKLCNTPSNFTNSDTFETDWLEEVFIGHGYIDFIGYMDDLVVTKDVLYTANFNVPDRPMGKLYPSTKFLLNLYQSGPYPHDSNNFKVY